MTIEIMPGLLVSCDHLGCKTPPVAVPQVWIPEPGWVSVDTTKHGIKKYIGLHFCEAHKSDFDFEDLLTDRVKAAFEDLALARWGSRALEFDKGWMIWVNVRDPDYIAWVGQHWPSLLPAARQHIGAVTGARKMARRLFRA